MGKKGYKIVSISLIINCLKALWLVHACSFYCSLYFLLHAKYLITRFISLFVCLDYTTFAK